MSLDADPETFRYWLNLAADEVVGVHGGLPGARVTRVPSPATLRDRFAHPLPRAGEDPATLIPAICAELLDASSLNLSPRFFGYVISSGTQIGAVAELLQGGFNLCPAKWDLSASGTEVERCAVRWIAEFVGLPAHTGGALVSGGTVANLTGLAAARTARAGADIAHNGLYGLQPLTTYVSTEGHACHERNLDLLGLGRAHLAKIPVRDDFTIDCNALERRVLHDRAAGKRPFCVIGNAGTTNTGAVDDLAWLADFCARESLWFHVDGAYGAPAARTASAGALFAGLDRADSIALDPHKWLFAPLEAGCILMREPGWLQQSFAVGSDYLRSTADRDEGGFDWFEHTLQHTRDLRALKVWLAFRAYGADRILAAIEDNVRVMRYFARRIDEAADFELLAPVPLSTVCFRYRPAGCDDEALLDALTIGLRAEIERDGRVHLPGTRVRGREALRACTVNHRTTRSDVDVLFDVVRELGTALAATGRVATR